MAWWLFEHYDPWDTSLNVPNDKLLIYDEDVHATLGLLMGSYQIQNLKSIEDDTAYIEFLKERRRRWNITKGAPHVGSMYEIILQRGGHRPDFVTDFIIYAISTCIIANSNGTCNFRILKHLQNVENISSYNWCAFVIKCMNNTIMEWKADKTKFLHWTSTIPNGKYSNSCHLLHIY